MLVVLHTGRDPRYDLMFPSLLRFQAVDTMEDAKRGDFVHVYTKARHHADFQRSIFCEVPQWWLLNGRLLRGL